MHPRTLSRVGIVTASLTLALLFVPALAAQETSTTFTEAIDVEVVNLDVYVTDKKGRSVTGLGRDDFELYADGEQVEVTNFYAVEGGRRVTDRPWAREETTSPAKDDASALGTDPLFLVVFLDSLHLGQFTRNRLVEELRPFLKKRHGAGDQIMIVTFNSRVRIRQTFTRDWDQVVSVIRTVTEEPSFGQLNETAYRGVIDDMLLRSDTQRHLPREAGRASTKCPIAMGDLAKRYAQQLYGQVHDSVTGLSHLVDTLASLPGRKALLHVSDGLPMNPGAEVFEFLFQFCGGAGGESIEYDPFEAEAGREESSDRKQLGQAYQPEDAQLDATRFNTGPLFEELTSKANASRVTFFTFEAYGPRNFSSSSAAVGRRRSTTRRVDEVRRANLQDSLFTMAQRTGGQAILDTTQFPPALDRVGQDFDAYYSLGYKLSKPAEGRNFDIRVETHRKDAELRYRKSLRSRSQAEDLAGRTQSVLIYGFVDNPLTIAVQVGESLPMDDGMHLVPIRVRIPIGKITLVPDEDVHQGQLTLYLTGRDQAGKEIRPVRSAQIPIRVPDDQLEIARQRVYLYEVKMLMRSGGHTLALGLHDDIASVASFITEEIEVAPGLAQASEIKGQ